MEQQQKPGVARERRGISKVGVVTSNKMQKTVTVRVDTLRAHNRYCRTVRRSQKFMAHDPQSRCAIGDRVVIVESRPMSKNKRWRVREILQKSTSAV